VRPLRLARLALVVAAVGAAGAEPLPAPEAIAVVVGRKSFVTAVNRDELRDLYLRRQRLWPNGALAIPVNLPPGTPLREEFSKAVLGRSSDDLVAYWNGRYFEGIRPPVVLPSAAAVRAYVAAEPAAIGYVPAGEVDDGCRMLLTLPPRR
jgi:hypothetical protein